MAFRVINIDIGPLFYIFWGFRCKLVKLSSEVVWEGVGLGDGGSET